MLRNLFRRLRGRRPIVRQEREAIDVLVDLLVRFEGFRRKAYLCPAKVWTVGYGCTRLPDGRPVKQNDRMDKKTARAMLHEEAETALAAAMRLTQGHASEAAAAGIASLIYNVGPGAVAKSRFLKAWNAGEIETAEKEFLDFCRAGGKVLPGLVRRREAEWKVITGG